MRQLFEFSKISELKEEEFPQKLYEETRYYVLISLLDLNLSIQLFNTFMNSLSYLHSTLNQINDTGVVHSTVVDPRRLYAHQSVTHTHYLPAVVHKENCIPGHHYYKLPRYAVI